MRRSVAAFALIALFASLPSFGAEPTAVAPCESLASLAPADALSTPATTAAVPAPNDGEILYWLKAQTPTLPKAWLLPPGCGAYCRECGGCCAIGPNWCACC